VKIKEPALKSGTNIFLVLAVFAVIAWVPHVSAQQTVDQMPTAYVKSQADFLVLTGKFAEAIPFILETMKRLDGATDPKIGEELERLTYSLGYCYFATDQYPEAVETFVPYLEKYGDVNITRTVTATDLLANALFFLERYDEATVYFNKMIASRHTPLDRKREARILVAEAAIRQKNWEQAIALLEPIVKDSSDQDLQSQAAVFLCQAYVNSEKAHRIFNLLPLLESAKSLARNSVEFNLTMLQGADRLMANGNIDLALPLLLVVAPRRFMETWIENEITESQEMRAEAASKGASSSGSVLSLVTRIKALEAQKALLASTESYDEELRTRIAQCFFKQGRNWEALWVYEGLMNDFPESVHAEDAAFAGMALAGSLGLHNKAIEFGERYLEQFPEGKNYDEVGYQLCQLFQQVRDFPRSVKVARMLLDSRPDSIFGDQLLFLAGYNLLMQEKFKEAEGFFLEVRSRFPDSGVLESSDYWYAMNFLFQSDYQNAMSQFQMVADRYPKTSSGIDAIFREAVCLYALEKFPEAKAKLTSFITSYPGAPQVAESRLLLGDIAAGEGLLDEAKDHYLKVEGLTINQGQIDYAATQLGKVFEAKEDWEALYSYFSKYLSTYGTKGFYAEAIYRIGQALKNKGDSPAMLARYLDALRVYGNDRAAVGMDLILNSWGEESTATLGEPPIPKIREQLLQSENDGKLAMALRWRMALDQVSRAADLPPPAFIPEAKQIPDASPAVLIWLASLATEQKNSDLAKEINQAVLDDFPDTEWNESALLGLARLERDANNPAEAIEHYRRLRELFPSSESAGFSLEEEAMILISQKQYKEATSLLESILEVKEWRGELWARSLFRLGEINMASGKTEEAFGYFQRVYVLYSFYQEWVGKAYIQSAACLAALGRDRERQDTLREFTENKSFEKLPEYQQALNMLEPQPKPQ